MAFKPRKGDAPTTGRVRPSTNFERTMALASLIAAESVPDEHTVFANEQAPAVVEPGVLTPATPTPATPTPATPTPTTPAMSPTSGERDTSGVRAPGEEAAAAATRSAMAPPSTKAGRPATEHAATPAPDHDEESTKTPNTDSALTSGEASTGLTDLSSRDERETAASVVPDAGSARRGTGEQVTIADGSPTGLSFRGSVALTTMPIDAIRKSPFQPKGRPSQDAVVAVQQAAARLGGIERLVGVEGQSTFQELSAEAKRLAELVYSVVRDGVRDPVEVRRAEDGRVEALSGHRRLAAASLAGLTDVPILDRGPMSALQAAATVLSGNLHRENFTPWQEAVLVTEVVAQRRADGLPADVRTIGAIMGYSHGRVSTLLAIRRVVSDAMLGRLGELAVVEEALARYANYSRLEEIARLPDDARREQGLRRVLGLSTTAAGAADDRLVERVYDHRPKRRGGFTIEVFRPIEQLAPSDAAALRELFAAQLARLDARLQASGSPPLGARR